MPPRLHVLFPPTALPNRPKCPKCGWPMWLSRIEPEKPGFDARTFECPSCEYAETKIAKIDEPAR